MKNCVIENELKTYLNTKFPAFCPILPATVSYFRNEKPLVVAYDHYYYCKPHLAALAIKISCD